MKKSTTVAAAFTVFSCFALLTMPMNADAGRFRGGNTVQANVATQTAAQIRAQQYNFVDADGDGICDNTGLPVGVRPEYAGQGLGFVDADGDGINDNFIDADGDGICDRLQ